MGGIGACRDGREIILRDLEENGNCVGACRDGERELLEEAGMGWG